MPFKNIREIRNKVTPFLEITVQNIRKIPNKVTPFLEITVQNIREISNKVIPFLEITVQNITGIPRGVTVRAQTSRAQYARAREKTACASARKGCASRARKIFCARHPSGRECRF